MGKFLIQPHVRLQEWVAEENGYFEAEGLDYEFEDNGFGGATKTTTANRDEAPKEVQSGAFEDMQQGRTCDISSACHWAVNAAAAGSDARMYGKAYSVAPAGIFVAADSGYNRPEDLAGVPVAVGYHSGSHYSAIQGLESFLDRPDIKLSFSGTPWDRVRLLMRGHVPAANVFGAQYYLMEQLGFRKLVDTTFVMGAHIPAKANTEDIAKYYRALEKAQRDIDLFPERYKKHWLKQMPEDLAAIADVRRFGPGERVVFQPYTREMYEVTQKWMKSWDLLDLEIGTESASYEKAVLV
ncbi:hypothetical protein GCM10027449_01820 [Sinomonas notoginsengisoli]|uniref:ABC transporter substrate-binding protein n=1 Tax=Sinomonas notoginsengisoli TaxID=1457311 RepID=UPI001F28B3CC|nr:hypothetical protein [Sinomonas notoginsengisoli]